MILESFTLNYIGVGYTTFLDPAGVGREAVRLISQRSFTHGLIITDLSNMPGGVCGITAGRMSSSYRLCSSAN